MSAWLLAALLCAPASAQVFEAGGAAASVAPVSGAAGAAAGAGAAPSSISVVPAATVLAPSLDAGAVIRAFPGRAATGLPAGAVRLASPIPALPAAAAASAAPASAGTPARDPSQETSAAPSRRDAIPPSGIAAAGAARAVAADRNRAPDTEGSPEGVSARLDAAGRAVSGPLAEAGGLDLSTPEKSAALGRKIFDRVEDRAALDDGSAGGAPGEFISDARPSARDPLTAASDGENDAGDLRDAVASPIPAPAPVLSFFRSPASLFAPSRGAAPAAAAPGAAAAPIGFERLSLELGSGLVVKVRAALGFAPAAAALAAAAGPAGRGTAARLRASRSRAPITSTEWLERRGLLESLSASEAAASQEAAALPGGAAGAERSASSPGLASAPPARSAAVAAAFLDAAAPVRVPPFAWWVLALLPAGLVLLKEFL